MKCPPYLPCFHSPFGGLILTPARICVPWGQGVHLYHPCITHSSLAHLSIQKHPTSCWHLLSGRHHARPTAMQLSTSEQRCCPHGAHSLWCRSPEEGFNEVAEALRTGLTQHRLLRTHPFSGWVSQQWWQWYTVSSDFLASQTTIE